MKRILATTIFIFSTSTLASPVHLKCSSTEDKESFYITLNEQLETATYHSQPGISRSLGDKAVGFFKSDAVRFRTLKGSEDSGFAFYYTINRINLNYVREWVSLEDKSSLAITNGRCEILKPKRKAF